MKRLIVTHCHACPFFAKSLIALLANRPHGGDCRCDTDPQDGKIKRLPVEDGRGVPGWCPLKLGDLTVTLGN